MGAHHSRDRHRLRSAHPRGGGAQHAL